LAVTFWCEVRGYLIDVAVECSGFLSKQQEITFGSVGAELKRPSVFLQLKLKLKTASAFTRVQSRNKIRRSR